MPYSTKKRERVEGWPLIGTKAALEAKANAKGLSFTMYVNSLLEKAAGIKADKLKKA